MKRIISLVLMIVSIISISACSKEDKAPVTLNSDDIAYIDMVYSCMEDWDDIIQNSGQSWTVDKIAFYDFDGTNNLCFYALYPVTDIYGSGYFVDAEGMYTMDFSVYETEEKTRSSGWFSQTRVNGTDWNHDATDEQKYEILKQAYLKYKESEQL